MSENVEEVATTVGGGTAEDVEQHEVMFESSQDDTDAEDTGGSHSHSSRTPTTGESSQEDRSGSTTSGSNVSTARGRKSSRTRKRLSATTRIAVQQLDDERAEAKHDHDLTETPTFASMRADQLPGVGDKMDKKLCEYLENLPKPPPARPIDCPPMYNTTHDMILDYIGHYNLEMLLEHLLALCLIEMPDDPFEFIAHHCGHMVQARTDPEKYKQLTRLFYPKHVHAMYRVFDKEQNGHITNSQYKFAMQALGLTRYTVEPKGYRKNSITQETFTREACHALEVLLKSFMA